MEATPSLVEENISNESIETRSEAVISIEFIAYAALILLAVVLRIAQLDAVPLTDAEARGALAAWRTIQPDVPGSPITPESPLLFFLHSLSFSVLGASEFSARIWTALGGVGLILSPLLFSDLLGRGRTFICCVLLAFSPVLLVASRTDNPIIWTVLVGVLALWALWRYYHTGRSFYAILTTVFITATTLLADPTGLIFVAILVGGGLFAWWISPTESPDQIDAASRDNRAVFHERLGAWPWQTGLLVAALVVVLISSLFMLHSAGLSSIGSLIGAGARGLTVPRPGVPFLFPILVTLFYEPVLLIIGLAAIIWMLRRDQLTFVERFFIGWLIFGLVASVAYAGSGPEHALWLVLPLAGLSSSLIAGLLARVEHPLWWDVPAWSKWIVMIATVALLGMFAIHIQAFARALINSPEGSFQFLNANTASIVWVIISLLFMVIGFFLASSVWGIGMTVQGAALGLLAFGLVTSLGSGWRAAVVTAENPVELWNRQPVSSDVFLLRKTMNELANRQTSGFPQFPVLVYAPDDGILAWTLRDFVNARFINDFADARNAEIVLLPQTAEPPDLGSNYVGQTFAVSANWNFQTVQIGDWLAWWLQQKTRLAAQPSEVMVLWLRQDVYNGVPTQPIPGS
jgi:hypothetical protein